MYVIDHSREIPGMFAALNTSHNDFRFSMRYKRQGRELSFFAESVSLGQSLKP
jgi:hypothetical protein